MHDDDLPELARKYGTWSAMSPDQRGPVDPTRITAKSRRAAHEAAELRAIAEDISLVMVPIYNVPLMHRYCQRIRAVADRLDGKE